MLARIESLSTVLLRGASGTTELASLPISCVEFESLSIELVHAFRCNWLCTLACSVSKLVRKFAHIVYYLKARVIFLGPLLDIVVGSTLLQPCEDPLILLSYFHKFPFASILIQWLLYGWQLWHRACKPSTMEFLCWAHLRCLLRVRSCLLSRLQDTGHLIEQYSVFSFYFTIPLYYYTTFITKEKKRIPSSIWFRFGFVTKCLC